MRAGPPDRPSSVPSDELTPPASSPTLGAADRLLVVAPHPDDETLGAGGMLQAAGEVGSARRVLFVTDGEDNPWAQRASEGRLVITATDRRRFGTRRRREALAALGALGLPPECAGFLALPDQGITPLLLRDPQGLVELLAGAVERFAPTVVAFPARADLHPDHSAVSVAMAMVLERSTGGRVAGLAYLIHGPAVRAASVPRIRLPLSAAQRDRKIAAIAEHRSQHRLRGPWLRSFAADEECFLDWRAPHGADSHPVLSLTRAAGETSLAIRCRFRLRAFGRRTVQLLLTDDHAPPAARLVPLPRRSAAVTVLDPTAGDVVGRGTWQGGARGGLLTLPAAVVPAAAAIYVKIHRRFGFFDEAGWRRFTSSAER